MRTWDENRAAMNQLWPTHVWTEEELRLVRQDLSPLDQDILWDAIRNAKRNHDTPFVHLKWLLDEYRSISRLRKLAAVKTTTSEPRQVVQIDSGENARMRAELTIVVDQATAEDYQTVVDLIAEKASQLKIEMTTAFSLVKYLQERLGMKNGGQIGDAA